jgi:hypothetical protein
MWKVEIHPAVRAWLLGDKSLDWANWYRENIPLAEERYGEYLENET